MCWCAGAQAARLEAAYPEMLRAHQIAARTMNLTTHKYSSSVDAPTTGTARMQRVTKELRSLRTSLPLNFGSSVFLRYDKHRPHVQQVVIAGPHDTPYESGLFLFDVLCGAAFPSSPVSAHTG